MSETAVQAPKKKTAAGKGKRSKKTTESHPKIAEMVTAAIATLKERNGSSLQAIKKYISSSYGVEVEKLAPFIRRYLKSSVASGKLLQTKGKGASGSFKLSGGNPSSPPKSAATTRARKPAAKTPSAPPKKMKPKSPKKASKGKSKRSPMKAKTPKPKKVQASKRSKGKSSSAPKQSTAP